MKYITETGQVTENEALNWLFPDGTVSYNETILCCTNDSVDKWNGIVQAMNRGIEYKLLSEDSFEEVDDFNGCQSFNYGFVSFEQRKLHDSICINQHDGRLLTIER